MVRSILVISSFITLVLNALLTYHLIKSKKYNTTVGNEKVIRFSLAQDRDLGREAQTTELLSTELLAQEKA